MNNYETLYLMNEVAQLAGSAFMDTLSVIFALVITGYVAGPKLTRRMLWGMVTISALFILPMVDIVRSKTAAINALSESLPRDQFDALPYLEAFAVPSYALTAGPIAMVGSLAALYAGAIFFVFHCHSKGTVTANS